MELSLLVPLLFASGYPLGRAHNKRWRQHGFALLRYKVQLIAVRNENKSMRHKGKRPSLKHWQKWLLGLLHWWSPRLTRYTLFRPETLIGWHRRYVRSYWWLISCAGKATGSGRPRIPDSTAGIIIDIKLANPDYGIKRIAALVSKQLELPVSHNTVGSVLKRHFGKTPPGKSGTKAWETFINNHKEVLASMDFKVVFDWRARPVYILSIVDHLHRQLVHCRCTYRPTAEWVAQQRRSPTRHFIFLGYRLPAPPHNCACPKVIALSHSIMRHLAPRKIREHDAEPRFLSTTSTSRYAYFACYCD